MQVGWAPSHCLESHMPHSANSRVDDWLNTQPPEEVLEPELPIIDAHHHLWDIRPFATEPYYSFQQKVYLCEDIINDIRDSGHNITQTVFAQCGAFYRAQGPEELRCVGETEFVHGVFAMSNSGIYGDVRLCTGIFSAADLRLGKKVDQVLRAHLAASENFRGIRTAFPSDLNEDFLDGFAQLATHNLSFDNWSPDFDRLPTLAKLANQNTDVTVIVNHLGGQVDCNAPTEVIDRWKRGIDAVAQCSNTVIKCGGGQMRIGPWEPQFHMNQAPSPLSSEALCEQLLPFYEYVINAFGPSRCMFESNFPVDRECASYRTLWNLFKRISARLGLSDAEKAELFSGTARRAYRLQG